MAIKAVHDWKGEADGLEFDELEERLEHYRQLREAKMGERRKTALAQIKELMATNELSAEDLMEPRAEQPKKAASAGRKMTPKYRNPANADEIWTGQGRAPKWMPESKEQWPDFLIKPE